MEENKQENTSWIIFMGILVIIGSYIIYVISNSTDYKNGCICSDTICISSHMEARQVYYGRYWHTIEDEVCDEYKTNEYDCDCRVYHWFWGDSEKM
jgi:hypothetical protein